MLNKTSFITLLFIGLVMVCANKKPEAISPQIIPIPNGLLLNEGVFILKNQNHSM
jgi:hypothetical protein